MEELFNKNKNILSSMLLDEEKLMTYVSISKDLSIHVNCSKILLQRIVEHVREKSPELQLNVSYLVCGATENNNARTIVCSEQELNKVKQCFKKHFFEHIYSVTKGCPSIDSASYLNNHKFEDFVLCPGLIKSKLCDKRTLNEIGDLKSNSQEIVVPEKSKSLPVPLKKVKQETNISKNSLTDVKQISKESQSEPILNQNLISPKKELLEGVINNKLKVNSTNGQKTQKGIAGFFNKKTNSCNKKEINKKMHNGKETNIDTELTKVKSEKMETDEVLPIEDKIIKEVDKKETKNTFLHQIKKTSKVDKKRKRVLHVSDSDSDSNDPFSEKSVEEPKRVVNHDSEDEIPATPTVSNIIIKSGIINPKKRRKVVDKTYTDEEGYFLTKKMEVYESCSENEDTGVVQEKPKQPKVKIETSLKEKTTASKKKISPPQKGKQSTLTNFFKKV